MLQKKGANQKNDLIWSDLEPVEVLESMELIFLVCFLLNIYEVDHLLQQVSHGKDLQQLLLQGFHL